MQESKIQVWEHLSSPYNPQEITVAEYIRIIKEGYQVAEIQEARKYTKGNSIYENTKKARKCFTFNFHFGNNHKMNTNITGGTGLLYIDIDNLDFDETTLDKSKVFIIQKSFGGKGWALITRVDGLTLENFKDTFRAIATDLGVWEFADQGAKKPTQFNICSYDPDIFVNYYAKVYTASKNEDKAKERREIRKENIVAESPFLQEVKKETTGPIRYSNAADFLEPGAAYTVYPEGVYILEAKLGANLTEQRHNYILNLALKLVYLNPTRCRAQMTKELFKRAEEAGITEGVNRAVQNALNSAYRYLKEGTLNPQHYLKRTVIFSWEADLTPEEKMSIGVSITNKMKPFRTTMDILELVTNWDENVKITAKTIAERMGVVEKTVQRNFKPLKAYIKARNAELKSNMSHNLEIPDVSMPEPYSVMLDELPQGRKQKAQADPTANCPTITADELFGAAA